MQPVYKGKHTRKMFDGRRVRFKVIFAAEREFVHMDYEVDEMISWKPSHVGHFR